MDGAKTPVPGVTIDGAQQTKRSRKKPAVNATFRMAPGMKAWLEHYADEQGTTVTAVVTEQLEQLYALVRITNHITASLLRNMKRYEKQADFMRAMSEQNIRHITTWEAGGTLASTVQRLAWGSLQQWLQHDPAERDAWLRFAVEGTEYWTPPASVSGDLFAENDMIEIQKPADPVARERTRRMLHGIRIETNSDQKTAKTEPEHDAPQAADAPRTVQPSRETQVFEAVKE